MQFDIDVAKLAKTFSVGEKIVVEIAAVKPLTVALKAAPIVRESLVVDRIKQLLPQLDSKPSLAAVTAALKSVSLPSAIHGEINRLVQNVLDKQHVNQPQALKQAIQSSGVFTEKTLLKQPQIVATDFKANLLKVASSVEAAINNKLSPSIGGNAQAPTSLDKPLPPLQTLSSSSLGKSQAATINPAINLVTNSPSGPIPNQQGQPTTLRSPFAFQTASTMQADMPVVGQSQVQSSRAPERSITPQITSTQTDTSNSKLTLLTTILQALRAYNATPSSVSVLNTSPLVGSLPSALPSFFDSVLTPVQASALAQALNKSTATEAVRVGGQLDVLLLQGLLKEVESLHARIQLNQLSMIKEPESQTAPIASWLIDLPVKDKQTIEFLQLQIDQFKEQRDNDEEDIWSVQLRLDTQNLGPMQATVTMHSDDIKIVMRAERAESAELLEQHSSWLHDALARLGVSVSHISCGCGEVAKPSLVEQYLAETTNLVDVSV